MKRKVFYMSDLHLDHIVHREHPKTAVEYLGERIAHKAVAQRTYEILCEAFEAQYEEDMRDVAVDSFEDVCVEDLG